MPEKRPLRANLKTLLEFGFASGTWDEDDISSNALEGNMDGTSLKVVTEKWWLILVECAKAAKQDAPTPVDRARLEGWLSGRYKVVDVLAVKDAEAEAVVTAECLADLKAQGMSSLKDLLWFELTIHLGRPAGGKELDGGGYRQPPSAMQGAKDAKKAQGTSFRTYEMVLDKASETNSIEELDAWFSMLTPRMTSHPHPFAERGAALILGVWQKVRTTLRQPYAIIRYYSELLKTKVGRGYPDGPELDMLLVASSIGSCMAAMMEEKKVVDLGAGTFGGSSVGTASISSGSSGLSFSNLGGSASEVNGGIESKLEEVLSVVIGVKSGQDDLKRRMTKMEHDWDNIGKCHICGKKGHKQDKCPEKDKADKEKK